MAPTSPSPSSSSEPKTVFKNPLLYSSIALAVAAVVVGWIVGMLLVGRSVVMVRGIPPTEFLKNTGIAFGAVDVSARTE